MIVEVIPVGPLQVNCIILGCPSTHKAVVIDAGADADLIENRLRELELEVAMLLNTHGHFDHVGAVAAMKVATDAPLLLHRDDVALSQRASRQAAAYGLEVVDPPPPDTELQGGEVLSFGDEQLEVLHTPGHSPGGVCFYREGLLVSGDTLFAGSIGRTDLPGGDHRQLLQSIREKLADLPPQTRVIPGHGPLTLIAHELQYNPYLAG